MSKKAKEIMGALGRSFNFTKYLCFFLVFLMLVVYLVFGLTEDIFWLASLIITCTALIILSGLNDSILVMMCVEKRGGRR